MSSVLTHAELAEFLQLPTALVARLVEETDLPRIAIAGNLRFITGDVLGWLGTQEVLLVDDDQPQVLEVHIALEQGVGADDDAGIARVHGRQQLLAGAATLAA